MDVPFSPESTNSGGPAIATTVPGVPGAEIREVAYLSDTLDGSVRVGGISFARRGAFLMVAPGIGRFLVTDGRLIEFARDAGADRFEVEQFLAGSTRAALVHQRGGLPLHSACLLPPDKSFAIAIAGHSGAGKSTLAVELVRRGWHFVGDDITPLYYEQGGVMAWPSQGGLKLWRDACVRFSIDPAGLRPLPGQRDKYLLPAEPQREPVRLGYIFLLERGSRHGALPVTGPARLAALATNTFKPNYLAGLDCVNSHFQMACRISAQAELIRLCCNGSPGDAADLLTEVVAAGQKTQG